MKRSKAKTSKAKTSKATTSKATTSKAKTSKTTTSKASKSQPKKPKTPPAAAARVAIVATALSRDGSSLTISLSDKRRVRVAATIASEARIRVGSRWTDALEARIERLADEQRTYARALDILATSPRVTKSELLRRLGGDTAARSALKSLAENGWL